MAEQPSIRCLVSSKRVIMRELAHNLRMVDIGRDTVEYSTIVENAGKTKKLHASARRSEAFCAVEMLFELSLSSPHLILEKKNRS